MEFHKKSTGRLWYGCLGWSRSLHSLHAASPVNTAGLQTSTQYLRAHISSQVILTSHRPGSQTVSFWYVNLSFRTKHKEYASNLLFSPIILPEHLSSPVKILTLATVRSKGFLSPWDEIHFSKMEWIWTYLLWTVKVWESVESMLEFCKCQHVSYIQRGTDDTQMPSQQGKEQQGKKPLLAFLLFCQHFCQLLVLEP